MDTHFVRRTVGWDESHLSYDHHDGEGVVDDDDDGDDDDIS